jgi:sensor histidine kinase regulating citrate/malate metabolism
MVKNIVETYGGSISMTSEKGVNTVFKVTIPTL